ncbi:MAG: hypothetical protein AC479_05580 [miscellaneous Crenarchaeota group-6 archaeon AD8-1]|nr:MAG: hypothetical protein AC479_05580 [miscellaneous Crenarchaeota group-6 archaeon AD8-1]
MIKTVIVGGGVSGAYCAYLLAKRGLPPVIFDPSHPREKPCGGLVSLLCLDLFPFLKKLPIKHNERDKIYVISPKGKKVCINFRNKRVFIFSRLEFDRHLLNMAIEKGAEFINKKVTSIERKNNLWEIKTNLQTYLAKTIIGADGVNSLVREKILGPLDSRNKGLCFGYLVRGLEKEEITIRFSPYRNGYLWIIPRSEHTNLGIGCSEIKNSYGIKKELDHFIIDNLPKIEIISKWAAQTPNIKNIQIFNSSLSGKNWILIGDAAGHTSPLSGEGILYSLLDGELAAQAIEMKKPHIFDKLWKETYGRSLFVDIIIGKIVAKKSIRELYCQSLKLEKVVHFFRV